MATAAERHPPWPLHPLHAVLLAGTVPLMLGAALSDVAYAQTFEVQWTNFASWLLAGGLVFAAIALAWSLIALVRGGRRGGRTLLYFLLLLALCVLGFIDTLVHARDAWAAMPAGLYLSLIVAALSITATGVGFAGRRDGGAP